MAVMFSSPLPPEEVRARLNAWAPCRATEEGLQVEITLRWEGDHFFLFRRESRAYTPEDGWVRRKSFRGWTRGFRWDVQHFPPFRGELLADGAGGSLLRGGFCRARGTVPVLAIFGLLLAAVLFSLPRSGRNTVLSAAAVLLYVRAGYFAFRGPGKKEEERMLALLRCALEE